MDYTGKFEKPTSKIMETGTIILLRPNFITCIFDKPLTKNTCRVNLFDEYINVDYKDILLVKLPLFKKR